MNTIKECCNKKENNIIKFYKYKLLNLYDRLLYKFIKSNLSKHCDTEFNILLNSEGLLEEDKMLINALYKDCKNVIKIISKQGHSSTSIGLFNTILSKLLNYDTLSPLTLKDEEFNQITEGNEIIYQNKRKSSYFKDNKGIYNIDAFTKKVIKSKSFYSNKISKRDGGCLQGNLLFLYENNIATGKALKKAYVKDEDIENNSHTPKKYIIPCTEIEVKENDYLMFANINCVEYKKLNKYYNLHIVDVPKLKGKSLYEIKDDIDY